MTSVFAVVMGLAAAGEAGPALDAKWHGKWTGELKATKDGKTAVLTTMALTIKPIAGTKNYTWTIEYGRGDKKQPARKYELQPGEKSGSFVIDEKNGIVLPMAMAGDVLTGQYEVGGLLYTTRYELRDGKLRFELTAGKKADAGEAGGNKVSGYATTVFQSAELSK